MIAILGIALEHGMSTGFRDHVFSQIVFICTIIYLHCVGGSKQYHIMHFPVICITVLHVSYTTAMQLFGQKHYNYVLNLANTALLGDTVQLCGAFILEC